MLNITSSNEQVVPAKLKSTHFNVVCMACFLCLVIVITVSGNSFALVVFRLSRKLRNVASYFIINRCISDLFVALFSMPFWISYLLTGWPSRKSGAVYTIWICFDIFYGTWSIISLAVMSIERCVCIVHPDKYEKLLTKHRAWLAVSFVLGYSTFTSALGYVQISLKDPTVSVGIFLFAYVVPVLIKMFTCRQIYKEAERQHQITMQEARVRQHLCQQQEIKTSDSCIVQSLSKNKRKLLQKYYICC